MRALVTGGGGFVGKAVVRQLLATGAEVISFQRGVSTALQELGVRCIQGDITQPRDLVEACDGVDVLFHIAAKTGFSGSPESFYSVNVAGSLHVIDACIARSVPRLVYCSSPSVTLGETDHHMVDETIDYPSRFLAAYPRTKAEAEQRVLAANGARLANGDHLKTVSLRPHLIFGPGDEHLMPRLISRAKRGRLRIIGDGKNQVDWTYVDNVAHAHLCAAAALLSNERGAAGKAYFITNGEPVLAWPWFNEILSGLGLPRLQKRVPLSVARSMGKLFDTVWRWGALAGEPPLTEFAAVQVATTHTYSIRNAQNDLGYQPIVSLDDGVKRTLPWLMEQLRAGRFD